MQDSAHSTDSRHSSVARSERDINVNDSHDDNNSMDGDMEDVNFNRRNFSDYQDDRKIVKQVALNDKYKLVERPRFLFQFENTTWEPKFGAWVFRKHFSAEVFTYCMKCVFDLVLVQAAIISKYNWNRLDLNLGIGSACLLLKLCECLYLFCRKVKKPRAVAYQFTMFFASFSGIVVVGPSSLNFIYREAIEVTFVTYMMLAFLTRSFQFKIYAVLILSLTVFYIVHNYEGVIN